GQINAEAVDFNDDTKSVAIEAIPEAGIRSARPTTSTAGSNLNYTEPMYVMRSQQDTGANESAMNINIYLPLGMYKNTILAIDKDLYFNNEVILLRVVWAPRTKVSYANNQDEDSAGDPDVA